MICVRHGENELSEKKGGKVVVVRSEWIGAKPAEICCLGPGHYHVTMYVI
jgi:hypothetical protein